MSHHHHPARHARSTPPATTPDAASAPEEFPLSLVQRLSQILIAATLVCAVIRTLAEVG